MQELQITAVASATQRHVDEAIATMQKAVALEEATSPPPGPPPLIKPAHETLGDILLRAGRPAEAAAPFAMALYRQPNRARALLGTARAAVQRGDRAGATRAYTTFVQQWAQGDAQLPEIHEAQAYLQRRGAHAVTQRGGATP